jgi:hypothetical protein
MEWGRVKEGWQDDEGPRVHQLSRTPMAGNVAVGPVWDQEEVEVSAAEVEWLVEVEAQAKPQVQEVLPSWQVQGLVVVYAKVLQEHAKEPQEHPQEVHHHPGKAQGLGVHL